MPPQTNFKRIDPLIDSMTSYDTTEQFRKPIGLRTSNVNVNLRRASNTVDGVSEDVFHVGHTGDRTEKSSLLSTRHGWGK